MDHSFAKEVENGVASAHEALPLISRGDASPGSLGGGRGSSLRRPALFLASLLAVAGVFLVGFDVGIADAFVNVKNGVVQTQTWIWIVTLQKSGNP